MTFSDSSIFISLELVEHIIKDASKSIRLTKDVENGTVL